MKILIISQYFWPEIFKITDLAIGLKERGHEVTVLTGKPNYPAGIFFPGYTFFNKRIEYYNGIKIVRSPLIRRGSGSGLRLFLNYFSFAFFASFSAVFRLQKKNDVIFVYEPSPITVGLPAVFYKFFSKAPLIFWVQDLWPESLTAAGNINSSVVLNLIESLVKYIYKHSDIILISSKSFRQSIVEKGINSNKIVYLPNWAENIFNSVADKDLDICKLFPVGGFYILFAGNVGDAQDFDSIVKAVELTKHYKNIHWIIVGDGRKKTWVEQQKNEMKLENLHLIGRYPMEKMPNFFREADILLVTLKNEKIFSMTVPAKIQSYLACGKPILAMINGDGADIINESKAGFAINAGEYEKLAEKVIEMYNMPKERLDSMALSGKEFYHLNFDRKVLIDNVVDLIKPCYS